MILCKKKGAGRKGELLTESARWHLLKLTKFCPLFVFSPLCIFTLAFWDNPKLHWLHLFGFSPLCEKRGRVVRYWQKARCHSLNTKFCQFLNRLPIKGIIIFYKMKICSWIFGTFVVLFNYTLNAWVENNLKLQNSTFLHSGSGRGSEKAPLVGLYY